MSKVRELLLSLETNCSELVECKASTWRRAIMDANDGLEWTWLDAYRAAKGE